MHSKSTSTECPNCGTELRGEYCAACGQRQIDLDRPFREIVSEGLSTFLAFDTKLVRTLGPLVRRPGFLTEEYLAGRRARYVHPFKLYFAFSLVFFFAFAFSEYKVIHSNEPGVISIGTTGPVTTEAATLEPDESSSGEGSLPTDGPIDAFISKLLEFADNNPEEFNRLFVDRLSKSLIVMVPIVALLLQGLYWRLRYVAHLVFSLHIHSFAFLVLVIGAVIDVGLASTGIGLAQTLGNTLASLLIPVYTFLALRRAYGQGRLITLMKLVVLIVGYAISLALTMLGTLIVTVAAV